MIGEFDLDVVLPSQLGARDDSGERRLMLAVIVEAVRTVAEARGRADQRRAQRDVAEVLTWAESGDRAWPYSFLRLCDGLGIDPEYVRAQLKRRAPQGEAGGASLPSSRGIVNTVRRMLAHGSVVELATLTRKCGHASSRRTIEALKHLRRRGEVVRVGRGQYQRTEANA